MSFFLGSLIKWIKKVLSYVLYFVSLGWLFLVLFCFCFAFVVFVVVVCNPLDRLLISLKHLTLMHLFPSF